MTSRIHQLDVATFTNRELAIFTAGYTDALRDQTALQAQTEAALSEANERLTAALADAAYWERIANPPRIPTGPTHAQLERTRHELMTAARQNADDSQPR